ncbi:MAG: CotH kinase family protein, partial [Planctomycetota bacterium]
MLNPRKFISLQPHSKRNGGEEVGSGLLLVSLLLLVSVPTGAINGATVGNTDVFAEPYAPANRRAVPFTMPESGTIQSITMFHDGGSSGNMLLAVYDDNAGYPGSRIAVTSETATDILPGWQTIDLITPVYVEVGARIWLAWVYEDMPAVRQQQTTPENARASTDPPKYWSDIPRMPLSFGGCNLNTPRTYSVYATYTPAGTPDEDPPKPNPSTWASPPFAVNFSTITMAATPAADQSGVEYYFDETSGNPGGTDSSWQHSNTYTDYGLAPKKQYAYRVKTRDLSPLQNDGDWSTSEFADTPEAPVACPVVDLSGNCQVDFQDLRIFAMQWLDEPGCPGHPDDCANLDRQDNGINFQDYSFLADEWRKSGILVVINEFMASNGQTIADPCDNDYEDWIEIYNASIVPFDIGGMWLADEQERWQIPRNRPDKTTIAAGGYLIIWADEENWQGPLHADFKINKDRDELGLFAADGTLVDGVDVDDQKRDTSHGRYPDAVGSWYDMSEPTPGSTNSIGMAPVPHFSHPGGTFSTDFSLGLTTTSLSARVYYTTNGAEPDEMSTLYTTPFSIGETTWVRARAYEPNLAPGPIVSNPYVKLDADLQNFQSNLPIVLIDSFGLYIDKANRDFHEVLSVFVDRDSNTGRAVITGPADYAGYGGMHVRGASSSFYPKKPYRLETWDENRPDPDPRSRYLDKNVSLLGLPEESDWIFYGPCSDKTLMRNYQMYTWSNLIGRYASRTIFVELFTDYDGDGIVGWNGGNSPDTDYRGVYVLMEKIKRDENRVDIAKLEPHHNSEPEITGGYLLKKDWEWDGFETDIYKDFLIYSDPESDELTATQKNWLKAYFSGFETVLSGPDFDDPVYGYAAYIDVGSFVDHHILVEVAKNVDGF